MAPFRLKTQSSARRLPGQFFFRAITRPGTARNQRPEPVGRHCHAFDPVRGLSAYLRRATPVLLLLVPCAIAANQPTFTYAVSANTTVAAMAVDAAGNTYLTGSTTSLTFPATAGALQTQFDGGNCVVLRTAAGAPLPIPCTDAFVIKLDPAGNVLFATYFGGNGSQTGASAICVDASGNVYLGGTTSPNTVTQPDTFPITPGAAFTGSARAGSSLNSTRREPRLPIRPFFR